MAPASEAPGDSARLSRLLVAARAGDEQAFERLTAPHHRALHVHCYRMLGSFHDADDALQETLLRAWRGLDRYELRGTLLSWLYRIATNVSLTALERRARRASSEAAVAPDEVLHMQPYPDVLLDELPGSAPNPDVVIEERESVALAFVVALQLLPPRQRAALLLRDVLGWSAREAADLLGDSVASVNSALQRARQRLERERRDGALGREHAPASASEADLVRRFVAAWEEVDVDRIVRLLADDALMTMPPTPERIVGRAAIGAFLSTTPAQGNLREIRLVPTAANGQPALAAYLRDPADGALRAYGIMVLAMEGGEITSITGFAECASLFGAFGLPGTLEDV